MQSGDAEIKGMYIKWCEETRGIVEWMSKDSSAKSVRWLKNI